MMQGGRTEDEDAFLAVVREAGAAGVQERLEENQRRPRGRAATTSKLSKRARKNTCNGRLLALLHDMVDHRRVLERLSISIVCTLSLKPGSRNRQRITGNLAIKCCKWVSTAATIAARSTLLSILWLPAMTEVPPAPFVDTENQPKVHGILPKSPEYHREPPRLP